DDYYQRDMLSLFSIMFDPARVWTSSLPPMQEDGAPSAALQLALDRARLPAVSFPFAADAYLIHLGRGTLARVAAAGDTENRYLRWAMTHTDPHFADAPAGPTAHARFVEIFERAIAELTPAQVAQACAEPGRVAIG
ncbi:MAG: hypothetical protein QOG77_733, partial [Solirubrobacteraceae bacterium]|nr:hypothetical protein [Solirubrobacteraceae bacterium]